MQEMPERPNGLCYWVQPWKLLAGPHPGSSNAAKARQTLQQLLEAGVTIFIDLTEEGEYHSYERQVEWEASKLRHLVACYRIPVEDNTVPSPEQMIQILDTIGTAVETGHTVYVHCLHGTGRTGTVVGCYLVRHGMSSEEAIAEIARLRQGTLDERVVSPRHKAQREMVLNWPVGK